MHCKESSVQCAMRILQCGVRSVQCGVRSVQDRAGTGVSCSANIHRGRHRRQGEEVHFFINFFGGGVSFYSTGIIYPSRCPEGKWLVEVEGDLAGFLSISRW